jgi:transcriptional regulator with XRE-family HTH domain
MTLADLGVAFRQARLRSGLTQQEVSQASGVPRSRISQLESGRIEELGTVKLLSLFNTVGLELVARPWGHRRTLDDVIEEMESAPLEETKHRQRVRHRKNENVDASGGHASGHPPASKDQEQP